MLVELVVDIIIPSRYASVRYPGKPLVELTGASGEKKTLVRRSWEAAKRVGGIRDVIIATDHDDIADEARSFGADVVMTSSNCRNGTERCAEVVTKIKDKPDVVVNWQGDALLTPQYFVSSLIDKFKGGGNIQVATPAVRCTPTQYKNLLTDARAGRTGATSVVFSKTGRSMYFSKRIIPFTKNDAQFEAHPVFFHTGVYAYTLDALKAYIANDECTLEKSEGLEQLRFLNIDIDIHAVQVEPPDWEIWELNNPEDVPVIERALNVMGII